jgi:hypothetical protein
MPDKNTQNQKKITIEEKRKQTYHNSQPKEFRSGRGMHTKLKNQKITNISLEVKEV